MPTLSDYLGGSRLPQVDRVTPKRPDIMDTPDFREWWYSSSTDEKIYYYGQSVANDLHELFEVLDELFEDNLFSPRNLVNRVAWERGHRKKGRGNS